ncbi:uncharacterized protein BT62DRAFT_574060 [Guyanagaster necrorhizus]|uniref:Uncharacterized protein n=1 Tax=Guyanagaster necrorhizus TaxID=856835 RepID=A0A9P7VHN9_9AGAR|nr:uncharacterized protein BT62DRAFT_574060 [Guyanagaster necrorhizus MCA 3950]KAG7440792.1 hypothetical protein BT62DRAFT_574060 [Guyanagaster necrorhizus MCA 3950]
MVSIASQTGLVEYSNENKFITNMDVGIASLLPTSPRLLALDAIDPLGLVGRDMSASVESGDFSAVENRDGDISFDTTIVEKSSDPVVDLAPSVDSSTGATPMVNDSSMNAVASSTSSDWEEDSIEKVIEDLFGEESFEPDPALVVPSLPVLHGASPLHTSLVPAVSTETEKDLNDHAWTGSPSYHSIRSTPPRNRSASIHSTPRASSHDRHSIRSTPPSSPLPHIQLALIKERQSLATQLSSPFKIPTQMTTSPVILASSPPPGLNYEEGDDHADLLIDDRVSQRGYVS